MNGNFGVELSNLDLDLQAADQELSKHFSILLTEDDRRGFGGLLTCNGFPSTHYNNSCDERTNGCHHTDDCRYANCKIPCVTHVAIELRKKGVDTAAEEKVDALPLFLPYTKHMLGKRKKSGTLAKDN